jgi:hypothetical protein
MLVFPNLIHSHSVLTALVEISFSSVGKGFDYNGRDPVIETHHNIAFFINRTCSAVTHGPSSI